MFALEANLILCCFLVAVLLISLKSRWLLEEAPRFTFTALLLIRVTSSTKVVLRRRMIFSDCLFNGTDFFLGEVVNADWFYGPLRFPLLSFSGTCIELKFSPLSPCIVTLNTNYLILNYTMQYNLNLNTNSD